jgi:hypothetical protein
METTKPEIKVRNKRKPFGVKTTKLAVSTQMEGFHYRWVNDEPGRLSQALEGDYSFVDPKEVGREPRDDNRTREYAGLQKDGITPMYTYLMKIPQEFYVEDQQNSQKNLDDIDDAIRGGQIGRSVNDNRYVPKDGISIK